MNDVVEEKPEEKPAKADESVNTEAAASEKKPRRTRRKPTTEASDEKPTRRRRKAASDEDAAADARSADAATEEVPAKKPRARRKSPAKKKAAAPKKAAEGTEDASGETEGDAAEAKATKAKTAKPKTPRKRAATSRKKPSAEAEPESAKGPETSGEEPAEKADAGPASEEETPKKPRARRSPRTRKPRTKKTDEDVEASSGDEKEPSAPTKGEDETPGDVEPKEAAGEKRPKRRPRRRPTAKAAAEADRPARASSLEAAEDDLGDTPRFLERADHPISRKNISEGALKVLYRLDRQGYAAYLVGGGVRDLLLGRTPKDFDVATDARPPEMKRLFRNARIIGRRFRLAHVIFHGEVVEVSTFRKTPDPKQQSTEDDDLLITSDNTWGTPSEDAFRRDFTINALFYDISDFSVIDYVGGLEDLEAERIRVIGDPAVRFQEDPVRMMRACEFAGRLGFDIEEGTRKAIEEHAEDILRGAPPRLVEEVFGVLRSGNCEASLAWMNDVGMLEVLLPELMPLVEAGPMGDLSEIPRVIDEIVTNEGAPDDAVLLGAVLLPLILAERFAIERETREWTGMQEFRDVLDEILEDLTDRLPVPNAKIARLRHAFLGFHRMCAPEWTPARRIRIARKSYFADALRLFEILVMSTGAGGDELEAWKEAQKQGRRGGGGGGGGGGRGRGRGRRRRRR